MNRPAPHSRRIPYIVAGTALFALLAFLLSQTGYYSFCYLEQWDTFIYNSAYLSGSLALPGGCVQLLSSFLTQFFCRPLTGILITALLLTWIALLTADILHRWTKSKLTLPLALFPVAALFFLHYNVNYQYAGTIAFLWMLLFLFSSACGSSSTSSPDGSSILLQAPSCSSQRQDRSPFCTAASY